MRCLQSLQCTTGATSAESASSYSFSLSQTFLWLQAPSGQYFPQRVSLHRAISQKFPSNVSRSAIAVTINLCAVLVRFFVANLSVWFSGYPYLSSASEANAIVFPFAIPICATSAHRHCCHFLAATGTKVCNFSCVNPLPTAVSCKRHPHTTAGTLWGVRFVYSPLSHCQHLLSISYLLITQSFKIIKCFFTFSQW